MASIKPVLILRDHLYLSMGTIEVPAILGILRHMGIPFEIGWTDGTYTLSNYQGIIVPRITSMKAANTGYTTWVNGSRTIPVFVWNMRITAAANLTDGAHTCGASAIAQQAADGLHVTTWGNIGVRINTYLYTLDSGTTSYVADGSANSMYWKRPGTGNDVYWFSATNAEEGFIGLVHWLAQIYTTSVYYPWVYSLDHPEEANATMLQTFVNTLKGYSACCAAGIQPEAWGAANGATKTVILAEQDTLVPQVHSHTVDGFYFGSDIAPYDTAAAKLDYENPSGLVSDPQGHRWLVTWLRTQGFDKIKESGSHGFQFLPLHLVTRLGLDAMATASIKSWRLARDPSADTHPFGRIHGNFETLHTVGTETRRLVGRHRYVANVYNATTLANLRGGATDIAWHITKQRTDMYYAMSIYNSQVVEAHGANFTNENPGQYQFDIHNTIIQMGAPVLRWTRVEDIEKLSSRKPMME